MSKFSKVVSVGKYALSFDDGSALYSYHEHDCCEEHYLDFSNLSLQDFDGLEFDLKNTFFNRIDGYGIELIPVFGHSVKIPGYGSNNGYYSHELDLVLKFSDGLKIKFDITECQDYSE